MENGNDDPLQIGEKVTWGSGEVAGEIVDIVADTATIVLSGGSPVKKEISDLRRAA